MVLSLLLPGERVAERRGETGLLAPIQCARHPASIDMEWKGSVSLHSGGFGDEVGVGGEGLEAWGRVELVCFGFLETVSLCGSHYPGTLNPASASTGLELQACTTMVGKTTLSGQCQLRRNGSQGQLTSNEPVGVGPMGLGFLGLKNPRKDRAAGGEGSSPAQLAL